MSGDENNDVWAFTWSFLKEEWKIKNILYRGIVSSADGGHIPANRLAETGHRV